MLEEDHAQGPPMIVATKILRAPRTRIGKVYGNITLPRSVELRSVVAVLGGAVAGLVLWTMPLGIIFGYSLESLTYMMVIFGGIGLGTLHIQPMKGEPLWRWALLKAQNRRDGRNEGKLHICTRPLDRKAAGKTLVVAGCVDVAPKSFDGRGSLVRKEKRAEHYLGAGETESQGFAKAKTLPG